MRQILLAVSLFAVSCAHPERRELAGAGGPAGITLAGQLEHLVLAGDPGAAHPGAGGMSQTDADKRYLRLTGTTASRMMTGPIQFGAGVTSPLRFSTQLGFIDPATLCLGSTNAGYTSCSGGARLSWVPNTVALTNVTGGAALSMLGTSTSVNNDFTATTYLRTIGVATGSLPACGAGIAGAVEYDTTIKRAAVCDDRTGSFAWRYLVSDDVGTDVLTEQSYHSNLATIPSPEAANYNGIFLYNVGGGGSGAAGQTSRIACQIGAGGAGVVGGATTGVVMAVRDLTGGANVCTCTLSSGTAFCNAVAGSFDSCTCSGALTTGRFYGVQMSNTTDCGTNPGNLFCTVNWTRTLDSRQQP